MSWATRPVCSGMVAEDVMVLAEVDPEQAFRASLPSTRRDEWALAGRSAATVPSWSERPTLRSAVVAATHWLAVDKG